MRPPEPAVWRPIHYLGSKLRIVEPLRGAIDRIDPGGRPVCDLFAGSGTVSAALSSSRDVIAVDIQEYSRVLCSAILSPPAISRSEGRRFLAAALGAGHDERLTLASPLIEYERDCLGRACRGDFAPICELIEHAAIAAFPSTPHLSRALRRAQSATVVRLQARDGDRREVLVLRLFGGLYFSYRQAVALDSLLTAAHRHPRREWRDCLVAAVISTASDVVNTVGKHFAQPIRPRGRDGEPKRHLVGKIVRDRELDVASVFAAWLERYRSLPRARGRHLVVKGDFEHALKGVTTSVGVVYADPPYTRDHYSRFYHVLETMCLWDDPAVSTTRIRADGERLSRGMYRADRHQSPFCIKSQAPAAFERLFAAVRDAGSPLVLSYSPYTAHRRAHPRVMTVGQIVSTARKYFARVEATSAGQFAHVKLNASHLHIAASNEAELIFLCS